MRRQFLALVLIVWSAITAADQSAQTTPLTFVSALGRYRLTVFPMEDPAAFGTHFEFMVRHPRTLERATQSHCEATLERWVGNGYEMIWRKPLTNPISPVSAIVSAHDGSFVTFDDWGQSAQSKNVVVIYAASGKLVKKLALRDFVTQDQLEKLPGTVSTIEWAGHHILVDGDRELLLRVAVDDEQDLEKRRYRDVRIRMSDGAFISQGQND